MRRTDHSSRGVLPTVVRLSVIVKPDNEEAFVHLRCVGGGTVATWNKKLLHTRSNHHYHHISVMQLRHLLTRSGLTYTEFSSKVYHSYQHQRSKLTTFILARLVSLYL